MVADGTSGPGTGDEGIDELRARGERCLGMLGEFARIHLEVDAPTRTMRADEPDWIGRLRKVCFHVLAITGWKFSAGVEHVMATEIRAAYEQMDVVWKCVPEKFKLDEIDGGWWANEAKNGLLATYDHPTPQSLLLPAGARRCPQRREQQELCTARRVAGQARARVWACAPLSGGGAGRRREHQFPCDGGAAQGCPGTIVTAGTVALKPRSTRVQARHNSLLSDVITRVRHAAVPQPDDCKRAAALIKLPLIKTAFLGSSPRETRRQKSR